LQLPFWKAKHTPMMTQNMEDGSDMTLNPEIILLDGTIKLSDMSKYYYLIFPANGHNNRPSSTEAQKEVIYKRKVVPQEGVDSNVEGTSSGVERTCENIEKKKNFPDKTCHCSLNSALKLGTINGSDDDCSKCCNTTGKNISDSVSTGSDTAEAVNVSSTDLTAQDSSSSVKHNGHNSNSPDNTATSSTPLSRFTQDDANDTPENTNFPSMLLPYVKNLDTTSYVIRVVLVILTVLLYKRHIQNTRNGYI
jgi:hypothetical protein